MSYVVIFDMDGVIFDSERLIADLWREVAEEKKMPDIDIAIQRSIGITNDATTQVFKELYGEDFPYEEYKKIVSTRFHAKYDNGNLPTKPGIKELLVFLKENKIPTAVASSTRTAVVETEIRDAGLLPYFDRIIGGDQVTHSKPDPEIFLKAAEALNAKPEECYIIEDSFNGIRAAHAAGMHPVMVPDLLEPDDEIKALYEEIFPSLVEVRKYFEGK